VNVVVKLQMDPNKNAYAYRLTLNTQYHEGLSSLTLPTYVGVDNLPFGLVQHFCTLYYRYLVGSLNIYTSRPCLDEVADTKNLQYRTIMKVLFRNVEDLGNTSSHYALTHYIGFYVWQWLV
jgi:hypothetical protein